MNNSFNIRALRRAASASQRGLSLIELMVALTIGAVLIFGATQVYVNSRKSYGVNESVARLQETARYAMSVIEPDIRMANYWGLIKGGAGITNAAAQTAALSVAAAGVPANICGNNFAADLNTYISADNNGYVLSIGTPRPGGCDTLTDINTGAAWTTSAMQGADTITIRRASSFISPSTAGTLQICSLRNRATLFSDGSACTAAPNGQVSNLIVNAYYIDRNSAQAANLPSLRRKTLSTAGGAPAFFDQEIIPGVEDMQVQFGIDPTGSSGSPAGIATRYVDPGLVPANAQIVAVRIWLLVRSDTGETGYTDNRIYQYGDRLQATGVTGDPNSVAGRGMAYQPSQNPDASPMGPQHVRRLLISRTIQLRNAMGDLKYAHPGKFPLQRRQQGAALVIGLILLMVLTLLAISGMNSASLEFIMAGNEQYRSNAFQAAEAGIEQSMVQGTFNPAGAAQALAGNTNANDSWTANINPPANANPLMIAGNGTMVGGYFFDIFSIGQAVRGAQANNQQGVLILSPANNTTTADPNLPNPALVP